MLGLVRQGSHRGRKRGHP